MEQESEDKIVIDLDKLKEDTWKFFNTKKWRRIKLVIDLLLFVAIIIILFILIKYWRELNTNPCELCRDLGYICFYK